MKTFNVTKIFNLHIKRPIWYSNNKLPEIAIEQSYDRVIVEVATKVVIWKSYLLSFEKVVKNTS